ncbi:hypothetical protein QFZ97_001676 [Paraburkholderia youngii]
MRVANRPKRRTASSTRSSSALGQLRRMKRSKRPVFENTVPGMTRMPSSNAASKNSADARDQAAMLDLNAGTTILAVEGDL